MSVSADHRTQGKNEPKGPPMKANNRMKLSLTMLCAANPLPGTSQTAQSRDCRVARGTLLPHFLYVSLLVASLLLIGLTAQAQDPSKQQEEQSSHESGFLGDLYSKLQPDPKNADLLTYWKTEDALKNSSKFILDPVIIYLLPEAQTRGIDPEQLAQLAQYFTKAINSELGSGHYQIVTEPGPGVLVLRVAITNVEPNGGKENTPQSRVGTLQDRPQPGPGVLVLEIKNPQGGAKGGKGKWGFKGREVR